MSGPGSRRQTRRIACGIAAALLAAACGTTVPNAARVAAGGTRGANAAGDELSLGTGGNGGGTSGAGGTSGPGGGAGGTNGAGDGGAGGGGGANGGDAGGGGGANGGDAGGTGRVGRGVTDDKILIGRVVYDNAGAASAALGIAVPSVDTEALDKIMLDHINAAGGFGGRQVELVYYRNDANDGRSGDVKEQEMCSLWTQDQPVLAVLSGGADILNGCLSDNGIPEIYENVFSSADDRTFEQYPRYFELNAPELGATGRALATGLAQEGFFAPAGDQLAPCTRPVCTGVVTFDSESLRRAVDGVLKPTLAAAGQPVDQVAYVKEPITNADLAEAVASFPGIVLKFKSAGINRVIIYGDAGGGIALFMIRTGANQNYHPHYGLTSASGPQALIDSGLVPPEEMRGAMAVGWNPLGDLKEADAEPGPGFADCIAVMEAGGANPRNSVNDEVISLKTCDGFNFLAAALRAGLPDLTAESLVAGAEAQSPFPTALAYAAAIAPGHHSGTSGVRDIAYNESCTCFRYLSGLRAVS